MSQKHLGREASSLSSGDYDDIATRGPMGNGAACQQSTGRGPRLPARELGVVHTILAAGGKVVQPELHGAQPF